MKLIILAAVPVLLAATLVPTVVHAAGQPQLGAQDSAAATNGKSADQAEKSKMDVKKQRDAEKFQGQPK